MRKSNIISDGIQLVTIPVSEELPEQPRRSATVLVLRHSGLSYAEVAEAMNVKVGQVGTMLRRAESALRKELSDATRN